MNLLLGIFPGMYARFLSGDTLNVIFMGHAALTICLPLLALITRGGSKDEEKKPTLDAIKRMEVEEWLRHADRLMREGRYLTADELLQKVLSIQPENEVASSYQERIQFLIRQLSQRVGLSKEIQAEIRKYKEATLQRRATQISQYLVTAQRLIEEGYFRKALEQANRALALDPDSLYGKNIQQRLIELLRKDSAELSKTEAEYRFRTMLREAWQNGEPPGDKQAALDDKQKEIGISTGTRLALEREVRNSLYKEALSETWLVGGISAFTLQQIDSLREKYRISRIDHSFIEATLLREIRKNKVKATVFVVDEDENSLLEIANHLRVHSFAVVAAANVEEVTATLKSITPDLVLSEISIGSGLGSFDLYELIRSNPSTRSTPFFFMSTLFDRATLLSGKRLGVDEFITKPIDFDLLFATIDGLLARRSESQRRRPK